MSIQTKSSADKDWDVLDPGIKSDFIDGVRSVLELDRKEPGGQVITTIQVNLADGSKVEYRNHPVSFHVIESEDENE